MNTHSGQPWGRRLEKRPNAENLDTSNERKPGVKCIFQMENVFIVEAIVPVDDQKYLHSSGTLLKKTTYIVAMSQGVQVWIIEKVVKHQQPNMEVVSFSGRRVIQRESFHDLSNQPPLSLSSPRQNSQLNPYLCSHLKHTPRVLVWNCDGLI